MFQIETAGLTIRIENRFDYVRELCAAYLAPGTRPADFAVSVSAEELRLEREKTPAYLYSDEQAESVIVCEKICCALPAFDAFVMHSSAVAADGKAYAFAAASGVGKSTHTRFWRQVLGGRLTVINGDKPIYRFRDGQLLACGTPRCGKENWQTNTSAPLAALCLLERAEENAVLPADPGKVLGEIVRHFHLPPGGQTDLVKTMELIDRMTALVPVFRLRCRNDVSAAETAAAYFGLRRE